MAAFKQIYTTWYYDIATPTEMNLPLADQLELCKVWHESIEANAMPTIPNPDKCDENGELNG